MNSNSKEMKRIIDAFKKPIRLNENLQMLNEVGSYEDISVVPRPEGRIQRGNSDKQGRSFDIFIRNSDIRKDLMKTKMPSSGSMQSFKGGGPEGDLFKDYEWNKDTSAWKVFQEMNYIVLEPNNKVHFPHGKKMGGDINPSNPQIGYKGSTGEELPNLNIRGGYGYKVFKALLNEPSVKYIISDDHASDDVKNKIYTRLMNDKDLIWIATSDIKKYKEIVFINPKFGNVDEIKQNFESQFKGPYYYSNNDLSKKYFKNNENTTY